MGKINWGRVLAGGLLAGVVLNLLDWLVNDVWLMDTWSAAMQALPNARVTTGGGVIAWFVVTDLLYGIFLVWLYAAIRPRYGPGPKTALYAGLATWVAVGCLHAMGEAPVRLLPQRLYLLTTLAALGIFPLAAVVGAWAYREERSA
jgi:hypothetical protein